MKTVVPLVVFGVLTDTQYADCDSQPALWNNSLTRHYRSALQQIERAFREWGKSNVTFALQLGDVIDGVNRKSGSSEFALRTVLESFERHRNIPTFHTVGNHELYNFHRQDLAKHFYNSVSKVASGAMDFPKRQPEVGQTLYYSFWPVVGVKCLSLDCFEVSVIGYDRSHSNWIRAAEILRRHHGHAHFEGWDCADHLVGPLKRFQQMNGALGSDQLLWLENELADSDDRGETVIVYGHVCLHPESADWDCLLWNYEEVLDTFHRHRCVAAYLSGHTHQNGYALDSCGIHYLVFAGIIETDPSDTAFATVAVYNDRLQVWGYGREISRTLRLSPRPQPDSDSGAVGEERAST